jgi:transglutaminase-like putative cysteine protease
MRVQRDEHDLRRTVFLSVLLVCAAAARGSAAEPADYRTGVPDSRARQVPAEIQRGIFNDPDKYLEPLARFLIAGARDDFHKVKILHDWLADNIAYDVDSYFSSTPIRTSNESTLKRRRSVCHGYATLMEGLCDLAGIPCRNIAGYGRGYSFSSGGSGRPDRENHAWNAVYVDDKWYLVDVTWDAGHVNGRAYEKHYRTTYLFMEPQHFVFTHFPADARWQLLAAPLSAEQFEDLPYLRGPFFDYGLRLGSRLRSETSAGSSVQFALRLTQPVELMAHLTPIDGDVLPQRTLVQYEREQCRVYATFPSAGRYRVVVFCRPAGATGSFTQVANLDFRSSAGTPRRFPKTYATFDAMRGYLITPLYTPLPTGKPLAFRVRLDRAVTVKLAVGDERWRPLTAKASAPGLYELTTTIAPGQRVRLNARLSPTDTSYKTLIDFTPR